MKKVKAAFEAVFKAMVAVLGRGVRYSTQKPETTAMAIAALCVGGMVVARSLNDKAYGDRLRDASTHAALIRGAGSLESRAALRGE
jgi:hypothetical protein